MTAQREYCIFYIPAHGYVYRHLLTPCYSVYIHNGFQLEMKERYRILSVLELEDLLRSEWKLEHKLNQCLHLV